MMKTQFNSQIFNLPFFWRAKPALMVLLCIALLQSNSVAQVPWSFQLATNTNLIPDSLAAEDIRTAGQIGGSNPSEWDGATADLNLDGKADVVAVRKAPFYEIGQRTAFVLLNVNGKLVDVTRGTSPDILTNPSHARDIQLCDVNGDSFPDAIIANTFGEDPILLLNQRNNQNGRWRGFKIVNNWFVTAQGNSSFVADTPVAPATLPGITSCALACCDVEGDGDNDIILTAYPWGIAGGTFSSEDRILINNGSGRFLEEPNRLNHNFVTGFITTGVECADVDSDGDVDYVVSHAIGKNVVLFNDGFGFFNTANQNGTTGFSNYMFTLALINPDTVPDILGIGDGQDRSGINLGNGTFGPDTTGEKSGHIDCRWKCSSVLS